MELCLQEGLSCSAVAERLGLPSSSLALVIRACSPARRGLNWPGSAKRTESTGGRSIFSGWRYLAVWIDLFSRRVVGWTLDQRMDTALAIEALNRALGHRKVAPDQLLIHTDQGSQYRASDYREMLLGQRGGGELLLHPQTGTGTGLR